MSTASITPLRKSSGAEPVSTPFPLATYLDRSSQLVVTALALIALYFPTSTGGDISRALAAVQAVVSCVLLLLLLTTPAGFLGAPSLTLVLCANGLLWFFTAISPLRETALGAAVFYGLASLLLCTRVRSISAGKIVQRVFFLVNVFNLTLAAGVIAGLPAVTDFLTSNYSVFWPGLVEHMVALRKPVLTFGSHSVAAFFLFLFFIASFEHYVTNGRPTYFLFAVGYLVSLVLLRSSTALILMSLSILHVAISIARRPLGLLVFLVVGAGVGLMVAAWLDTEFLQTASQALAGVLSDQTSGLSARYSADGLLAGNLSFILRSPLQPVGFGFSHDLFFGDSGYVEMILRGSLALPVVTYSAFAIFLFANLRSRWLAAELLAVFLAFEVGWGNLIYLRTIGFLPFFLVVLNSVSAPRRRVRRYRTP